MSPLAYRAYQALLIAKHETLLYFQLLTSRAYTHCAARNELWCSLFSDFQHLRTSFSSVMNDRYTPFQKLHWAQLWDQLEKAEMSNKRSYWPTAPSQDKLELSTRQSHWGSLLRARAADNVQRSADATEDDIDSWTNERISNGFIFLADEVKLW